MTECHFDSNQLLGFGDRSNKKSKISKIKWSVFIVPLTQDVWLWFTTVKEERMQHGSVSDNLPLCLLVPENTEAPSTKQDAPLSSDRTMSECLLLSGATLIARGGGGGRGPRGAPLWGGVGLPWPAAGRAASVRWAVHDWSLQVSQDGAAHLQLDSPSARHRILFGCLHLRDPDWRCGALPSITRRGQLKHKSRVGHFNTLGRGLN